MGCNNSKPVVARAVIVGNDQSSGSTSFIERLYQGNEVNTSPTVGFNIEIIKWYPVIVKPDFTAEEFKQAVEKRMKLVKTGKPQFELSLWDVAANPKMRPLWNKYYDRADAVLFCVDSTKIDHLDAPLIQETLVEIFNSQPDTKKFGILCTKCDLPDAASVADIQKEIAAKAGRIKSICNLRGIDIRIFAISSIDNFPQKRVEELVTALDVKVQELKAANDLKGAMKISDEIITLAEYSNKGTALTWGTGQLDVVNWILKGEAPEGTSFLNDFNQSNPLT